MLTKWIEILQNCRVKGPTISLTDKRGWHCTWSKKQTLVNHLFVECFSCSCLKANYVRLLARCYGTFPQFFDLINDSEVLKKSSCVSNEILGRIDLICLFTSDGFTSEVLFDAQVMEEMVIGAPGVYNWTGTIIRVGRFPSVFIDVAQSRRSAPGSRSVYAFGKARVFNVTQLPQFQPNGYFGDDRYAHLRDETWDLTDSFTLQVIRSVPAIFSTSGSCSTLPERRGPPNSEAK